MTNRKHERFSVFCLQIKRFWRRKNFVRSVYFGSPSRRHLKTSYNVRFNDDQQFLQTNRTRKY